MSTAQADNYGKRCRYARYYNYVGLYVKNSACQSDLVKTLKKYFFRVFKGFLGLLGFSVRTVARGSLPWTQEYDHEESYRPTRRFTHALMLNVTNPMNS